MPPFDDNYADHPRPVPPPEWMQLNKLYPQRAANLAAAAERRRAPALVDQAAEAGPLDHAAALQKYLKLLDGAIEWCCGGRNDPLGCYAVAARLIKTSIDTAAALKAAPDRSFTQRIVVEYVGRARLESVAAAPPAGVPQENLKTIHGVGGAANTP